ncbi:MAG: primosomal protein N' [Clostridia bacterium]|nr:primosomal protein N' [Clostridia bacterium]
MTNSEFFKGRYARVYILDNPYVIDRSFDYFIPHSMEEQIGHALRRGSFVTVPFGRGNRKQIALVTGIIDADALPAGMDADKVKPIDGVCSDRSAEELILSEEQLALCLFLKEQTLCTIGEAVRTVVPSSALSRLVEYYKAIPAEKPGELSHSDLLVYEYILSRGEVSEPSLKNRFGRAADAAVDRLIQKKLLTKELNLQKAASTPTKDYYSLAISAENAELIVARDKSAPIKLTSALQTAALSIIIREGELDAEAVSSLCGATKTQLKALVAKGILKVTQQVAWRDPYSFTDEIPTRAPILLSDEQAEAYTQLSALADSGQPAAALLHGVTGSGKTCVILSVIDKMLDLGKGAIVLLPEISLTPQMASQFLQRYGAKVAVLHSALSSGERHDAYMKIRAGLATVVVGTRSAVFAPVQNLGLIVIDEEQEHTYKSDMNPKYHARDIARFRCAHGSALLLLSSATPSLESYHKAVEGKYHLIKLKNRYGNATLPRVEIKDMRDTGVGAVAPLSDSLMQQLTENFESKNQSVLFLNRRGYSTQLVCRSCGAAVTCTNCSVAMNYHTRRGTYSSGDMVCHWCGSRRKYPDVCPTCSSPHLVRMGYGTQRIEEELSTLLPSAKILRMDADTTSSKFSYDEMLGSFRAHRADVLLGTQMVTKGHDFPDVTLVGVLMADMSLYLDDYRAAERTFSMLTQVIGRAGRADKEGLALIQTMNPDSDVIKLACRQDYELFYEREIKLRRLLVFPPFCDIVLLTLSSPDEKELSLASVRLSQELVAMSEKEFSDVPLVSFGPFEAPVYRVENCYRMRMVVKCRLNKRSRALFSELLMRFAPSQKGIAKPILSIDFNPSSL